MPGKPGSGGPVPKRSDQRRRQDRPSDNRIEMGTAPAADTVTWPAADAAWHPIARDWYLSLRTSGQAAFYEPSDIAVARLVAQAMHELLTAERMSAQLFQSVLSGTTQLLSSESDRRRLRIELAKADTGPSEAELAATADMDAYRKRLAK